METQKELTEKYKKALGKEYSEDIVKKLMKDIGYIFEHNGIMYTIDKPRIQTEFWYGYGLNGITDSESETAALNNADKVEQDKEMFIKENLYEINETIESYKEILDAMISGRAEKDYYQGHLIAAPSRKVPSTGAFHIVASRQNNPDIFCQDKEFVKAIIEAYEELKKLFIKRLNTYLKRYGLSKVTAYTALID